MNVRKYRVTSATSGLRYVVDAQSWRQAYEIAESRGLVVAGVELDPSSVELRGYDDFERGRE